MYVFPFLLYVPALYADARLMNEMSASRGDRALPSVYIVVYVQFFIYMSAGLI
jgi:hypothetical protein